MIHQPIFIATISGIVMFSVLSWNIQYGKGVDAKIDLSRIATEIRRQGQLDCICLQEISKNDPDTDNGCNQFEFLQKQFPEYEAFYGVALDRSGGKDGKRRQFGNMILTRITPSRIMQHSLPSPADPKAKFMLRQCLELMIETPLGAIRLLTTHLEYFSVKQQLAQVKKIREIHQEACDQFLNPGLDLPNSPFVFEQRPEKMIICGDFNFIPESDSYQMMTAKYEDATQNILDAWKTQHNDQSHDATCGIHDRKQWPEGLHCRDYFFITQNLAPLILDISVDQQTSASDHQPIKLTFQE